MTNYSKLVPCPHFDAINIGLSPAHLSTMLSIFGEPGALTTQCSDPTNPKLIALLETRNVGPFKVTGLAKLVDHLRDIFAEVKIKLPEVFAQVRSDGMICVRAVHGTKRFSNHSFGGAIDIRFGDESDEVGDGMMQLGAGALAPFFQVRGWYWGIGFGESNPKREDSMHFEASDELIRELYGNGTGLFDHSKLHMNPIESAGNAGDTTVKNAGVVLQMPLLANEPILAEVAEGHGVLIATGGKVPGIGPVQKAINQLAENNAALRKIDLGEKDRFIGNFGEKTEAAVKAFQRFAGIDDDGRVGKDTIRALDSALINGGNSNSGITVPHSNPTDGVPFSAGNQSAFKVPDDSVKLVQGIDFSKAVSVGQKFVSKFAISDKGGDSDNHIGDAHKDPSLCDQILKFPDGTVFFSAKMAIDSDGSPRAGAMDDTGDPHTSLRYVDGGSVNAEEVPYFVLPQLDKFTKDDFISELGLKLGDYGVVIHKNKIAGAFVADEGPFFKIGEASIRVHELLEPAPAPWKTAAKKRIRDASVERDVLYFVFPRTRDMDGLTPSNAEAEVMKRAMAFFEKFRTEGSHI